MAGTSLLSLVDDVISILDDVTVMSKVAAKKTSGVLGDDLALNAQQLNGLSADRELPIIFKVFKGSLVNKLILVPAALLISFFIPWMIHPLLMIGGAFLCYEGMEKVFEKIQKQKNKQNNISTMEQVPPESEKIKGAVRTDFILSAEIIVIALGTFSQEAISKQILALSLVAILMTIGVYGIVALIIKLDDFGLFLMTKSNSLVRKKGELLVKSAPVILKVLAFVGTIAMFMVGGGIISHGIHLESAFSYYNSASILVDIVVGMTLGSVLVGIHHGINKLRNKEHI